MARPIKVPARGAANATPFVQSPEEFAPQSRLRNFFPHDVDGDRLRGGTRPGTRALFGTVMGGGRPVQAIFPVTRAAQVTGYVVPPAVDGYQPVRSLLTGRSAMSGALVGNLFAVNNVPSYEWAATLAGQGGPASVGVSALALSRDGTLFAAASNHVVGGFTRATVEVRSVATGELVRSHLIAKAGQNRAVTSLFFTTEGVFACTNAYLRGWYLSDGDDVFTGTPPIAADAYAGDFDLFGWPSEIVSVDVYGGAPGAGAAGSEFLYVAFNATTTGSPGSPGPVVTDGHYAQQFRAGVMRLFTNARATLGIGLSPMVQTLYGGRNEDAAYTEGEHGYWRVSERSSLAPRGCRIIAIDQAIDGRLVVARTNVGCGPTNLFEPDGTIVPTLPLMLINANATVRWEADGTGSILEPGLLGYLNDAPVPGGSGITNEPSLTCVKFDAAGDVYAAGRFTAAGFSAFKVRGADGSRLWAKNLTGSGAVIRAVTVDPTDNNPVFVGDRNNATGTNAHLWKLNSLTGDVVYQMDLPSAVSARAVIATPSGTLIYGSDQI